jgi:hypothetical protein
MVRNGGWGSQTEVGGFSSPILRRERLAAAGAAGTQRDAMVDQWIKPHNVQKAEEEARAAQRRATVRNQAVGMVMLAAAALAWWLVHTNPGWVFPAGWWHW